MKHRLASLLCAAILSPLGAAEVPDAAARGTDLAARLRTSRPAEPAALTAQMRHRPTRGPRVLTPLRIVTRLGSPGWTVSYEPAGGPVYALAFDGVSPPRYARQEEGGDVVLGPEDRLLGSDFFLGDLGLEFLFWPGQRMLRRELRRSRWCEVLESTAPVGARLPYRRVVAWVDDETGGLIRAEAFDHDNRLWKVFSPGGVRRNATRDGYELKDIEISDVQADTFTVLEFDRAPVVPAPIDAP